MNSGLWPQDANKKMWNQRIKLKTRNCWPFLCIYHMLLPFRSRSNYVFSARKKCFSPFAISIDKISFRVGVSKKQYFSVRPKVAALNETKKNACYAILSIVQTIPISIKKQNLFRLYIGVHGRTCRPNKHLNEPLNSLADRPLYANWSAIDKLQMLRWPHMSLCAA